MKKVQFLVTLETTKKGYEEIWEDVLEPLREGKVSHEILLSRINDHGEELYCDVAVVEVDSND